MYLTCIYSWKGKGLIVLAEKLKITKSILAHCLHALWILCGCLSIVYNVHILFLAKRLTFQRFHHGKIGSVN